MSIRRRDYGFLAIGLIIGLFAGIAVFSSESVRDGLFGTAGLSVGAQPAYYLVSTGEARAWLTSTFTGEAARVSAAFDEVALLVTTSNFGETVRAAQDEISLIVDRSFTALTGLTPANTLVPTPDAIPDSLLNSLSDGRVSTCLGLDENPYNVDGYALYLYIEIPSTQADLVPETWTRLNEPKGDDLFWQRLACQTQGQTQSSQRR